MAHLNQNQIDTVVRTLKPLSRKAFLIKTSLIGLAASYPLFAEANSDILPEGINYLNIEQFMIFKKVTAIMLPLHGTEFTPLDKIPYMQNIDNYLGDIPSHFRDDFFTGLSLFKYASIIIGFNFNTFTNLSDEAALSYCQSWQQGFSFQQALINVLQKFVIGAYWSDEKTWGPIEYFGPVTRKNNIPRLGNAPTPIHS